jgi:hypothetical protein
MDRGDRPVREPSTCGIHRAGGEHAEAELPVLGGGVFEPTSGNPSLNHVRKVLTPRT